MMKRILTMILCISVTAALFAQTPVLREVKGKVEVKPLGKGWVPATSGMKLIMLDTISTGFDGSAVLVIADNKVAVAPLTRLTIDKVIAQAASTKTSLHLRVGSVSAEVKSSTGVAQDFSVTSPYSTASVRGTRFVYDGLYLDVQEGRVAFIPGKPTREIMIPFKAKGKDAGSGAGGGSDGAGGDSASGDAGGPGSDAGATPQPEVGAADFLAALQSEFGSDSFNYEDSSGSIVEPSAFLPPSGQDGMPGQGVPSQGPQVPPPGEALYVTGGNAVVIEFDYSGPGQTQSPGASKPKPTVSGSATGGSGSAALTTIPVTGGEGGGVTGAGGSATTDGLLSTPPLVAPRPPAPTKGSIKIIWK
ncbi:MAG: FecR family protein [Rectinemataceae bacterium]